jgi:hypothetical protein
MDKPKPPEGKTKQSATALAKITKEDMARYIAKILTEDAKLAALLLAEPERPAKGKRK